MTRRSLVFASLAVFLCLQSPVHAQETVADGVVERVESEGYTVTSVKRSWLGRIVITANKDAELREVVVSRSSGEILRDQRFATENPGAKAPGKPTGGDAKAGRPDKPGKPDGKGGAGGPSGPGGQGPAGGPGNGGG